MLVKGAEGGRSLWVMDQICLGNVSKVLYGTAGLFWLCGAGGVVHLTNGGECEEGYLDDGMLVWLRWLGGGAPSVLNINTTPYSTRKKPRHQ